ncbi:MAG TPA: response regulator [Desulfobacteraceae bacterium]|nr:response regulator [Desulfobacteraceae bacterium]
MEQTGQQKHILILESDRQLAQQIQEYLSGQASLVTAPSSVKDALDLLKSQRIHLAFLGDPPGGSSSFDILKDFVKTSPMTYVILITDTPEKEVHDRAEGFGILGHIPRAFSPNEIERLIDKYREINQALFR